MSNRIELAVGAVANGELTPHEAVMSVTAADVEVWDGALAPGYGQFGEAAREATKLLARTEGLILDPVYTAKAFAALPAMVESGDISASACVCFVHTGGLAALFAYEDAMSAFA